MTPVHPIEGSVTVHVVTAAMQSEKYIFSKRGDNSRLILYPYHADNFQEVMCYWELLS